MRRFGDHVKGLWFEYFFLTPCVLLLSGGMFFAMWKAKGVPSVEQRVKALEDRLDLHESWFADWAKNDPRIDWGSPGKNHGHWDEDGKLYGKDEK